MKCLLCNYQNSNKKELEEHYVKYHNIDENNLFFKKVINQNKNVVIHRRKCIYCNQFVFINKADHDFLKHYGKGLTIDTEENIDGNRPVNVSIVGDIKKIEITFKEHSSHYDFFDSVAVVDSFLAQCKRLIQRYDNNVLLRVGFSIENVQQPLDNYSEPLFSNRYWSTDPIQTKSFNDFVLLKTRESILSRVVNNRLSGSAWHFNKFNYLNIKIIQYLNQLNG